MTKRGKRLDSILWGILKRAREQDVLEPDEGIILVERVGLNTAPGALTLTNKRLMFVRSTPWRRTTELVAFDLKAITGVEASESRGLFGTKGVIRVVASVEDSPDRDETFEYIEGGKARADEIAVAILSAKERS